MKNLWKVLPALLLVFGLVMVGCGGGGGGGGKDDITWEAFEVGGASGTTDSTHIKIVFSEGVTNLPSTAISLVNGAGEVSKNGATSVIAGTNNKEWLQPITVQKAGTITVSILLNATGLTQKDRIVNPDTDVHVSVHKDGEDTPISFHATANGTENVTTTTEITLVFIEDVADLDEGEIEFAVGAHYTGEVTLTGVKAGTDGKTWILEVEVERHGHIGIIVNRTGIDEAPEDVMIHKQGSNVIQNAVDAFINDHKAILDLTKTTVLVSHENDIMDVVAAFDGITNEDAKDIIEIMYTDKLTEILAHIDVLKAIGPATGDLLLLGDGTQRFTGSALTVGGSQRWNWANSNKNLINIAANNFSWLQLQAAFNNAAPYTAVVFVLSEGRDLAHLGGSIKAGYAISSDIYNFREANDEYEGFTYNEETGVFRAEFVYDRATWSDLTPPTTTGTWNAFIDRFVVQPAENVAYTIDQIWLEKGDGTLKAMAISNTTAMEVEDTRIFTVTNYPSDATSSVTWTSSNTTAASFSGNTLTANAQGTTTITATDSVSGVTASFSLTVNPMTPFNYNIFSYDSTVHVLTGTPSGTTGMNVSSLSINGYAAGSLTSVTVRSNTAGNSPGAITYNADTKKIVIGQSARLWIGTTSGSTSADSDYAGPFNFSAEAAKGRHIKISLGYTTTSAVSTGIFINVGDKNRPNSTVGIASIISNTTIASGVSGTLELIFDPANPGTPTVNPTTRVTNNIATAIFTIGLIDGNSSAEFNVDSLKVEYVDP